jgi:hypothetical protein
MGDKFTTFMAGSRLRSRVQAQKLVRDMWRALFNLTRFEAIFESDIEAHINAVLVDMAELWNCRSLYMLSEHWPGVKIVAREMIAKHYENGMYCYCTDEELQASWMPLMSGALGWDFKEDEAEGSDDEMSFTS